MKRCCRCKAEKLAGEFSRYKTMKDGLNPRCRVCQSEINKAWQAANPDRARERWRLASKAYGRSRHGLSAETIRLLYAKQNGRCAICDCLERDAQGRNPGILCIDHDHACCPGRFSCGECVRGLLCSPCNRDLGIIERRLPILGKMVEYLSVPYVVS
jgi:hypothetical protein